MARKLMVVIAQGNDPQEEMSILSFPVVTSGQDEGKLKTAITEKNIDVMLSLITQTFPVQEVKRMYETIKHMVQKIREAEKMLVLFINISPDIPENEIVQIIQYETTKADLIFNNTMSMN